MIATMVQELESIRADLLFTVRNKLGLTREEAKKVFHRFRSPEGGGPEAGPPMPGREEMRAVMKHVQETAERLDRIERDLDYLKKQVDRLLEKV